jgi:cytidylate kinase
MKIAIDGPAASGKSTTAKLIANKLGFVYIDSGAMFRVVTLKWLEKTAGLKSDNDESLLDSILENFNLQFSDNGNSIHLNGERLDDQIRKSVVSQHVSYIASFKNVRDFLLHQQRKLAQAHDVVMDGRDIGTVVFPDAEIKFFLLASAKTRAQRRILDLKALGEDPVLEILINEIEKRDQEDSNREIAPLKKADDAIEIITDDKTKDEVLETMLKEIGKLKV